MNRRNNRRTTRQDDRRWANRTARLHRSAGRARQVADAFLVEPLEQRQFLAGDYPSFNQVFLNTSNPQTVPTITIDQTTGLGVANGILTTNGENDVAKFTAPKTEFITIQADTKSLGGTFDSKVEVYTGTPGGPATLVATGNDGALTRSARICKPAPDATTPAMLRNWSMFPVTPSTGTSATSACWHPMLPPLQITNEARDATWSPGR